MSVDVIAILGDTGSFKSCLTTYMLAQDAIDGRPIVANYRLKFPEQYPTRYLPFDQLVTLANDPNDVSLKDATIGLDELGRGADSYDFFRSNARAITSWAAQHRKDHAKIIYNDQRLRNIAIRLRELTDVFILCEDEDKWSPLPEGLARGTPHRQWCKGVARVTTMDDNFSVISTSRFNGKPWYQYYNTDEKIQIAAEQTPDKNKKLPKAVRTKAAEIQEFLKGVRA